MLEHIADVVKHRFTQTRIRLKVFANNNVCNVATERCYSWRVRPSRDRRCASIFHLRTNVWSAAFFFAICKRAFAQFFGHLCIIHKVAVMVERHRKSVWRIFGQHFVQYREIRRLDAHRFRRTEIEIRKIDKSRIRQVVSERYRFANVLVPERLRFFKRRLAYRIRIRLDFEFHQFSAKGKQAVRESVPVKRDVRRFARLSRKIHMRERSLSVLADGRRHQRNFSRKRFQNQDVMRRDNRRIKFCSRQFAERPVSRSRIHDLHRHIAKKIRMRIDRDICRLEFIGIFGSRFFCCRTRRHIE